MKKRIINHDDYPMVKDWSGYENTHTKLPCECQGCGITVYKSIHDIDHQKDSYCHKCANNIKVYKKTRRIINHDDYPMVKDWINYKNTRTKLPCECQECGITVYKNIHDIDKTNDCYCKKCAFLKVKKTLIERYGVEYTFKSNNIREKTKLTIKKKYGVENPMQNNNIREKTKLTIKKKYGVEYTFQSNDIQDKKKQSMIKRYGVEYHSQRNRESWQIDITSSRELFEKYLQSFEIKPTTGELMKKLGYKYRGSIEELLKQWDLYKYIDQHRSTPEKEISDYIKSLKFQTEHKRFKWGEIDILISSANVGFEYNGAYWHSEEQGKDKLYHRNKQINALKHGVTLYHIWEWKWLNNPEEVKSLIRNILGIDNDIEQEIKEINNSNVITDNGTTINELYEKHGFIKVRDIEPDYLYIYLNILHPKEWGHKSILIEQFGHEVDLSTDLNEDQMIELINRNTKHHIFKVWDCGKTEWRKIKKGE